MGNRFEKLKRSIAKRLPVKQHHAPNLLPERVELELERLAALHESTAAACHRLEVRLNEQAAAGGSLPHPVAADLSQRYAQMVQERDNLLNERDTLLKRLQAHERQRPLGKTPAPTRLPFPQGVLPERTLPSVKVIDVGAQMLASEDHAYQQLLAAGAAQVVGFEPLEDAAARRVREEGDVRMLNYVIGHGGPGRFHINSFDPTSSLRPANLDFLDRFESLSDMCRTVAERDVVTTRLDDVPEIDGCDFLKIDVQGCTRDVLAGADRVLSETVVVHCEVEFAPVYHGEALFGEVDSFLTARGFELIDIMNTGYATTRGLPRPIASSRLLWGDAVYFRTPDAFGDLDARKLCHAAFIAHVNYAMYDIAGSFLVQHDLAHGTMLADLYGRAVSGPAGA